MVKETMDVRRQQSGESTALKRRGVIAAAWAALAGVVLRESVQPVSASTAMLIADTEAAGVSNSVVGPSTIASTSTYSSPNSVFISDAHLSPATAALAAVHGAAVGPTPAPEVCGVYGQGGPLFTGVLGTSSGGETKAAVHGIGTGSTIGVQGDSTAKVGVYGLIPNASTSNAIAVYGLNGSTFAGGGPGGGGFGVYGFSGKGHGLVGATGTAGGAAVVGATNGVAGAYAAVFYGQVIVTGSFSVVGAKNAAVPHPDGSHRLLYSVESPESWFEDFGEAQLTGGKADVKMDPDFGALTDMGKYHVFLTAYGGDIGLHVTKRGPNGFSVETKDGAGSGTFSWRVVARRKDITGERLAKIPIPPAPECPSSAEAVEDLKLQDARSREVRTRT
jgi:hypothetical protein